MSAPQTVAIRVEVRTGDDDFTRAVLMLPDGTAMVLVTIPAPALKASKDVEKRLMDLAAEIVKQVIADALDGDATVRIDSVHRMDEVPAGAKGH